MKRSSGSNPAAAKHREAKIQQILAILHKWGIHTLGQLAALDKEQVGARLNREAVRMWERANGQSNRLLKLIRTPVAWSRFRGISTPRNSLTAVLAHARLSPRQRVG